MKVTQKTSKTKRATFHVDLEKLEQMKKFSYYTGKPLTMIVNESFDLFLKKYQGEFEKSVEEDLKKLKGGK